MKIREQYLIFLPKKFFRIMKKNKKLIIKLINNQNVVKIKNITKSFLKVFIF